MLLFNYVTRCDADLAACAHLERESFARAQLEAGVSRFDQLERRQEVPADIPDPWGGRTLKEFLADPDGRTAGRAAYDTTTGLVRGYYLVESHPGHMELARLVVHPADRRKGIGTALLKDLVNFLTPTLPRALVKVPEGRAYVGLYKFLVKNGWEIVHHDLDNGHWVMAGYKEAPVTLEPEPVGT